jgi:hypothetical protein
MSWDPVLCKKLIVENLLSLAKTRSRTCWAARRVIGGLVVGKAASQSRWPTRCLTQGKARDGGSRGRKGTERDAGDQAAWFHV